MRTPLTLRGFARQLGLAASTVSMALRNDPRIGEATRNRVRQEAHTCGFRVHPLVAAVHQPTRRRQRAATALPLAFITDVPPELEPAPPSFFGDSDFASIRAVGPSLGFRPEVFRLAGHPRPAALTRMLEARGYQAAILGPCLSTGRVLVMDWSRFAVVSTHPGKQEWPFHQVRKDPGIALDLALVKMRQRPGRIGVALCRHTPQHPDDRTRKAVFLLHRDEAPDRLTSPFEGDHNDLEGFLTWVRQEKPDLILGFQGNHFHALRQVGHRFPATLGYAQLHIAPEFDGVHVAGVEDMDTRLAAHAVRLVDRLLRTGAYGLSEPREETILHPRWMDGATLPPPGTPTRLRRRGRG
jgi:LacI family transcriptional regulator